MPQTDQAKPAHQSPAGVDKAEQQGHDDEMHGVGAQA